MGIFSRIAQQIIRWQIAKHLFCRRTHILEVSCRINECNSIGGFFNQCLVVLSNFYGTFFGLFALSNIQGQYLNAFNFAIGINNPGISAQVIFIDILQPNFIFIFNRNF